MPAVITDDLHDLVNVINNALDDDWSLVVLEFEEEFGECGFGSLLFLLVESVFFCLDSFSGDLAEFLHKLDALYKTLFCFIAKLFEALAEVLESGIVSVLFKALGEFLFQTLYLFRITAASDLVDDVGIEDVFRHLVDNAFHMDVIAFRPNAPRTYALNVLAGSDITEGNVFTSDAPMNDNSTNAITHLGGGLSGHGQHDEIDLDLSALADHTLETGESAIVQIAFSNGTGSGGGHHLFLDNVGFSGNFSAVPEPSGLAILGFAGIAVLVRRRK